MSGDEHFYRDFINGRMKSFYDEFYPSLLLYASRFLGEDYSFLSEDIVQDAVYKTLDYIPVYPVEDESKLCDHFGNLDTIADDNIDIYFNAVLVVLDDDTLGIIFFFQQGGITISQIIFGNHADDAIAFVDRVACQGCDRRIRDPDLS